MADTAVSRQHFERVQKVNGGEGRTLYPLEKKMKHLNR